MSSHFIVLDFVKGKIKVKSLQCINFLIYGVLWRKPVSG